MCAACWTPFSSAAKQENTLKTQLIKKTKQSKCIRLNEFERVENMHKKPPSKTHFFLHLSNKSYFLSEVCKQCFRSARFNSKNQHLTNKRDKPRCECCGATQTNRRGASVDPWIGGAALRGRGARG